MPVRARDLVRALAGFGIAVEEAPGGGAHWRARRGGTVFPLPLHNGLRTELQDRYVRARCRTFDIAEARLRERL